MSPSSLPFFAIGNCKGPKFRILVAANCCIKSQVWMRDLIRQLGLEWNPINTKPSFQTPSDSMKAVVSAMIEMEEGRIRSERETRDFTRRLDDLFGTSSHDPHNFDQWFAAVKEGYILGLRQMDDDRFPDVLFPTNVEGNSSRIPSILDPWEDGIFPRKYKASVKLSNQLDLALLEEVQNLHLSKNDEGEEYDGKSQGNFEKKVGFEPVFERLLSKPKLLESRKSEYSGFYKMAMVSNFPTGSGVVTTPPPYIAADRLRHRIRRGNPFCAFCYKNGEKSEIHSSHSLYYSKSSIVSCPILRNYVCKYCRATGDNAHTDSYCPIKFGKNIYQFPPSSLEARSALNPQPIAYHWYHDNFPPLSS